MALEYSHFQDLQALTGRLISGSIALQYFSREVWDTMLDLYCELGQTVHVGVWLENIGYSYTPASGQAHCFQTEFCQSVVRESNWSEDYAYDNDPEDYGTNHVTNIWNFIRHQESIQLVSLRSCPLEAILAFDSTTSFFPQSTIAESLDEWSSREYPYSNMLTASQVLELNSEFYIGTPRFPGDDFCYTISLEDFGTIPRRQDTLQVNSFRLQLFRKTNQFSFTRTSLQLTDTHFIIFDELEAAIVTRGMDRYSSCIANGIISVDTALHLIQREQHHQLRAQYPVTEIMRNVDRLLAAAPAPRKGFHVDGYMASLVFRLFRKILRFYPNAVMDTPYREYRLLGTPAVVATWTVKCKNSDHE
ncbi:hypothetical protein BDP27DRAFT_1433524 [Rhodocollybia butyracea]|uniref:Uncharacterized protein n=1 Tax=Rhodocollybia butyracea TaxID=206335 RepID=A0A9P5P6D4_9AGAR|nr:hypothetical protein BDP27DRAFT_1433524 [Rhodocollybia butyracea]